MSAAKNFLKYINSIPFGFTIKHYQTFGEATMSLKDNALNSRESWDALRQSHPHFSIPEDREEWLKTAEVRIKKDGQDNGLLERARDVCVLLGCENIQSVFSVGAGGAGLEYQIKKIMPEVRLVCSEYSPHIVETLRNVFKESDDVILFDIIKDDWRLIKERYLKNSRSTLLMYRLDAGFTNKEWRAIFESIHKAGIENIIYIPTAFLTVLSLWNRKSREIKWLLHRTPVSFAGHLRTKKKFQSFWRSLYAGEDMRFGGLQGFFLKKIKRQE